MDKLKQRPEASVLARPEVCDDRLDEGDYQDGQAEQRVQRGHSAKTLQGVWRTVLFRMRWAKLIAREKQHVAEDYALRLDMARAACHEETQDTLLEHAGLDPAHLDLSVTSCPRLNITECEVSELAERFIIAVYNPLSRVVREHLRVPVSEPGYSVYDHLGQVIRSQVNEIPEHIKTIPGYCRYRGLMPDL